IKFQFGVPEKEVIKLMREEMKASSWRMWRARMNGKDTKHQKKRLKEVERFRCSRQKGISMNKISKRSKS
ncbi:MAG: TIGR03643 family protein, partial [Raineya sp.]